MKDNSTKEKLPDGWKLITLESLSLKISDGIHATPKYSDAGDAYFINGNTLYNSKINISDDTKKVDYSEYLKHRRDLDQDNTILLSINGTIGSVAYYGNEQVVLGKSCAYIKLNPTVNVDFIFFVLNSYDTQKYFISEVTGSTIKNLSIRSIKSSLVKLPPLPEQNRIVAVLETWDMAIEKLTKKIEIKKEIKKWLMQELLTGKKRLQGFNSKWETVEIGEVFDYEQPTKYLVSSTEYADEHNVPVLTANKGFILGYTDETDGIYDTKSPVIIFDDFTTDNKFVDFKFKVKSSAIKILAAKNGKVNIKFLFEKMQLINFIVGQHKRHYLSEYQYIAIDIPEIDEQNQIENILTTADKEIEVLRQKLSIIQDQKKHLLNNLITGAIRTPETLTINNGENV